MFAYCNNNPVVHADSEGNLANEIINPNAMTRGGGNGYSGWVIPDKVREKEKLEEQAHNLFNTNEEAVLNADDYAFYKGVLVIRHSSNFLTSWAIGKTIFLNKNKTNENTLKHEYGHVLQEYELGTARYVVAVFIPSVEYNLASRYNALLSNNYYNMPWEYDADSRGKATRNHANWADTMSELYFSLWGFWR